MFYIIKEMRSEPCDLGSRRIEVSQKTNSQRTSERFSLDVMASENQL